MKLLVLLLLTISFIQVKASELDDAFNTVFTLDYLSAIKRLTPLAQQGNEDAQYWLAISYRMGRPSEDFSDLENEYKWYLAAAEGGNAYAMYRLGKGKYLACELLQDCKNGAEIWEKKAIAKWRKRAAAGSGDAMLELAYRDHNWFTRLPLINNLVGWTRLREALAMGSTYAVLEYATKARRSGSSEKLQDAMSWLKKMAEQGNTEAQHRLGELIQDEKEQLYWTRKAAEKNYGDSLFSLGYFYENGIGVEKDLNKSAFYYCILVRHSGARDACYQVGQQLTEDERQAVSDKVEEWLKHNQAYYPQHPLFY